jgi:hypothetical protein
MKAIKGHNQNGDCEIVIFVETPAEKRNTAFKRAEEMNKKDQINLPGDEWLIKEGWLK